MGVKTCGSERNVIKKCMWKQTYTWPSAGLVSAFSLLMSRFFRHVGFSL